jgi:glycosyltransferase involved in cell wall biosynthesis
MSLRHFGIYLAWEPGVDLQKEGLGRLLVAFLRASAAREDVRFVIVCPQWSRNILMALLESEGVSTASLDVVTTKGVPLILRIVYALRSRKRSVTKRSRLTKILARVRFGVARHREEIERRFIATRSVLTSLLIGAYVVILGLLVLPPLAVAWLVLAVCRRLWRAARAVARFSWNNRAVAKLMAILPSPDDEHFMIRLHRLMEADEAERMLKLIDGLTHVKAWYCPTAFWPAFNRIRAPRLMCVPDVVLTDFPSGFSVLGPELLKGFEIVERAISGGEHFVTYSSQVKWETLVARYFINPSAIAVVPHACWDLSAFIKVRGFADADSATKSYCELLLKQALDRVGGSDYVAGLATDAIRFLFYPSQFRPNKNVLALLRAYEHLLRKGFIQHKLILTGNPARFIPVREFIEEHRLENDVLCLHGLTTRELAACYKLADLAVNPSLSEGGCPFTLTEALSVDTPVVMARIPVTEEIVLDETLRKMMLFDPYDWQDVASRIEWALQHRELLLTAQREFYLTLSQRTWRDVVNDYIDILDGLVAASPQAKAAGQ